LVIVPSISSVNLSIDTVFALLVRKIFDWFIIAVTIKCWALREELEAFYRITVKEKLRLIGSFREYNFLAAPFRPIWKKTVNSIIELIC